jgi:hypothetical protein
MSKGIQSVSNSGGPSDETNEMKAGARITVYWPCEDYWYHGTVIRQSEPKMKVRYDVGDMEDVDQTNDLWHVLSPKILARDAEFQSKKRERIARLHVNARVSMYWALEGAHFQGTLKNIKSMDDPFAFNAKPHFIEYDDGDCEWTNLYFRKFMEVLAKTEKLEVGSRVCLWDTNTKLQHSGSIMKIDKSRKCPHKIKFDDRSKKMNWFNLNCESFDVLPKNDSPSKAQIERSRTIASKGVNLGVQKTRNPQTVKNDKSQKPPARAAPRLNDLQNLEQEPPQKAKAADVFKIPPRKVPLPRVLKKRKLSFLQDLKESEIGLGWKQARIKAKQEPQYESTVAKYCSICSKLCRENSLQATQCRHCFCQKCVKCYFSTGKGDYVCPQCKVPITPLIVVKSDEALAAVWFPQRTKLPPSRKDLSRVLKRVESLGVAQGDLP